jgi:hypothetical protein
MERDELVTAVASYHDYYGQYHHHKEQMAYSATVLYLAGAAWLVFAKPDVLDLCPQKWYRIAFVTIVAIAAFAFVVWQLRQRRFAANVVEASTRILTRLGSGEAITLFDARDYKGLLLPHFFVDELVTVAEARSGIRGAGVSELITYATMVLAAILVALQLIG